MSDLDLTRTRDALLAYDADSKRIDALFLNAKTDEEVKATLKEHELRCRKVAAAFADDTSDQNNRNTVMEAIKPGPAHPAPGCELSFVRLCVRWWETQRQPVAALKAEPGMTVYYRKRCHHDDPWQIGTIDRVGIPGAHVFKVYLRGVAEPLDFLSYEWEQSTSVAEGEF